MQSTATGSNYNLASTPPVTKMVSPVIYDASSDTMKATQPAISWGTPTLFW